MLPLETRYEQRFLDIEFDMSGWISQPSDKLETSGLFQNKGFDVFLYFSENKHLRETLR